jgi:transposase
MARPYSQDLRDRVVGSVASGRTCRATAALFGVSVASVVKWSQRWRTSGSAAAKQMGGWRPLRLKRERAWLLAQIAEKPDLTLRVVVAELAERGTPASYGAVWRFFKHEGITFKKTLHASEQDRADVARRRIRWKGIRAGLTPGAWYSSPHLWSAAQDVRVWRPIPVRIDGRLAVCRCDHIDVRVISRVAGDTSTDLEHLGLPVRAVLQAMAVCVSGRKARGIPGAQNLLTAIRDEHHLPGEDIHELVAAGVPVPLARPGARRQAQ